MITGEHIVLVPVGTLSMLFEAVVKAQLLCKCALYDNLELCGFAT